MFLSHVDLSLSPPLPLSLKSVSRPSDEDKRKGTPTLLSYVFSVLAVSFYFHVLKTTCYHFVFVLCPCFLLSSPSTRKVCSHLYLINSYSAYKTPSKYHFLCDFHRHQGAKPPSVCSCGSLLALPLYLPSHRRVIAYGITAFTSGV